MSTETVTVKPYLQFVATIKAKCEELGIPLTYSQGTDTGLYENANWVCIQNSVTGHKVYVPKNAGPVKNLETTLPCLMLAGSVPMAKANGKIVSRFKPDADLVIANLLPLLADSEYKLPENRKPTPKQA